MSAQLANASASFTLGDVSINLACSSPAELLEALRTFGKAPAANDIPAPAAPKPAAEKAKPAATPAPTQAPQPEGNASASTAAAAGAQPAASGSVSGGDAPAVTYKEVSDRVTAMSRALGRDRTLAVLGQFKGVSGEPVNHGTKLQLPDYPAFIAAADKALGATK